MKFQLDDLITSVEKEFGKGTLAYATALKPREYRGSGSIALDIALGGGYGKSTIVDVIGKQSAGKTLLFEMAAVEAQRVEGLPSCLFDFEGTFDPTRFVMLGGDLNGLLLVRAENFVNDIPMFIEWAADMLKIHLRKKAFACIGNDSTGAMVSKHEFDAKEEKGEEQQTVGKTAAALSSVFRQIVGTGLVARSGATIFFMSQMRDNIGGKGFKGMPPTDKRTGGRALPFYASTQLEISRGDVFKADVEHDSGMIEKDSEVGHETKVRVRKNKNNAKQGRVCSFTLYTEGEVKGLDRLDELTTLSVVTGVVKKSGSWLTVPGFEKPIQGESKLKDLLASDTKLFERINIATRLALETQMTATALPEEVLVDEDAPPEVFEEPKPYVDPDEEMFARLDAREAAAQVVSDGE